MKRTRRGARIVLLTPERRFLLFHFAYDEGALAGRDYWGLPGGGMEEGESPLQAAIRELREETGIVVERLDPAAAESSYDFQLLTGEEVVQHDTYFQLLVRDNQILSRAGFTPEEARYMVEWRWWSREELTATDANIMPRDLARVLTGMGV